MTQEAKTLGESKNISTSLNTFPVSLDNEGALFRRVVREKVSLYLQESQVKFTSFGISSPSHTLSRLYAFF
jgi:hypothetical protein